MNHDTKNGVSSQNSKPTKAAKARPKKLQSGSSVLHNCSDGTDGTDVLVSTDGHATNPQPKALDISQKLKVLLNSKSFENIFDNSDAAMVEEHEQSFDALLAQLKQMEPAVAGGVDVAPTTPTPTTLVNASPDHRASGLEVGEDERKGAKKSKKKKKSNANPKQCNRRDTDDDVFEEFMALAVQDNQDIEKHSEHRRNKLEEFKQLLQENNALLEGKEVTASQQNMEVLGHMSTNFADLDAATTVKFCAIAMYMHLLYVKYPSEAPLCFTHNSRTMVVSASIRKTSAEIVQTLLKVVLRNEIANRKIMLDEFNTEDDRTFLRAASGEIGALCPTNSTSFDQTYVDFRVKYILQELIWDHTYCVRNCEEVKELWSNDVQRRAVAQLLLQNFWDDMIRSLQAEME